MNRMSTVRWHANLLQSGESSEAGAHVGGSKTVRNALLIEAELVVGDQNMGRVAALKVLPVTKVTSVRPFTEIFNASCTV